MDADRWQQVNALLDSVMELPPGEQRSYLDVHCEDDPELRREVLSLLEAHGEAESFLEAPAKDYAASLIAMDHDLATDPLIGTVVDGYQILGVLGRGGMGIVYKARDVNLDKEVALKMIDPALARDEAFVRKFRGEARALARIDSRHIVRVHAMRQTETGLYIVMEYVDGGTLSDVIREGPLPWDEAQPLVEQMLTALEHAHGVGVIHRDIKPSNIMLTTTSMVKVTDFGLAKVRQNEVAATVTQGIAGTIRYMSPEQVKGSSDLDHRSDLFSMGMTIYQLLAGRLPFEDDSSDFDIMRAIVEEPFPEPTTYHAAIPRPVAEVLMQALEKDPRRRFQSAAEMRAAFASAGGGPIHVSADAPTVLEAPAYSPSNDKASTSDQKKGLSQRTMMLGALGTLGVLLVAAVLILSIGPLGDDAPPEDPPTATSPLTLTSVPDGVRVYANDTYVGTTPLQDAGVNVGDGQVAFRFEKAGFLSRDTTLAVEADTPVPLQRISLVRDETETEITQVRIASNPSGAVVRINGERAGPTPLNDVELPSDEAITVEFRHDNCQSRTLAFDTPPPSIQADLVCQEETQTQTTTTPDPPARATLTLNVAPEGSIAVEGENCQAGTPCSVRAGSKQVTFRHPQYGDQTRTISVDGGSEVSRTFYFEQPVVIQVRHAESGDPIWGSIFVDGEQRGSLTDLPLRLGPGTHRVEVRRELYEVGNPVREVTIEPGFQQEAPEVMVFQISAQ